MYTRCRDCHTVHPLNAALLASAGGTVRCGKCGRRFSALDNLFDRWPEAGESPAPAGAEPPELGLRIEADLERPPTPGEDPDDLPLERDGGGRGMGLALAAAAVVLAGLLMVNAAWTFREPLLAQPEIRALAERVGLVASRDGQVYRDPSRIHLVSRDMHAHPTEPGVLVLNATVVNRAPQAQPLPVVDVTLLDAGNRPLAHRRFEPADYLEPGTDPGLVLAPNVYLPFLLELVDPGTEAVGFRLEFL